MGIEFARLGAQDVAEIGGLLREVWPQRYGKAACPVYEDAYLEWLYGGPEAGRHVLVGARLDGELVAFQCFLHRRIASGGRDLEAYLNTHATVSPRLPLGLRCVCSEGMLRQHALFRDLVPEADLVFAYFDGDKALLDHGTRALRDRFGVERRVVFQFNHHVVMPTPRTTRAAGGDLRPMSPGDGEALAGMFNRLSGGSDFSRVMTGEELEHHLLGVPGGKGMVVEEHGEARGFAGFHPLRLTRAGKTVECLVVEFLVVEPFVASLAGALLREALEYAAVRGARSVVLENATYLPADELHALGVMPSLRQMCMTVVTKTPLELRGRAFRCEVK